MSSTPEKKPVRRVRVIEVIDEDALDLDTAGTDPAEIDEDVREAVVQAELEAEEVPGPRPERKAPVVVKEGGVLVAALSAAVVALALLAGFAVYKWQSASSPEEERKALISRATAYGNVLGTYPATDVDAAQQRVLTFLTGDALAERQGSKVDQLKKQLTEAQVSLESKTNAVYVASIDGSLARVVLVFDMTFTGPGGSRTVEKNHLTLGMVKQNGTWMVSSNAAAGSEQNSTGAVPGFSDAPTPSPTPTAKK